ncbi:MAG: hypothetical protein WCF57_24360 [Pyrinomonadaceae bacterium]
MQTDEKSSLKEDKPWWRRMSFDFYYVEKVGSKYYLRITPFSLILMAVALLIFFIYLFVALNFYPETNTNIMTPPVTPYEQNRTSNKSVPSPSSTPKGK